MRFARTMEEGVVPEWKSQYLNYYQGKRLIEMLTGRKKETPRLAVQPSQSSAGDQGYAEQLERLPSPIIPPRPLDQSTTSSTSKILRVQTVNGNTTDCTPLLGASTVSLYTTDHRIENQLSPEIPHVLGNISRADADVFFDWLSGQVMKVESFYIEKEKEMLLILPVLEQQLRIFEKHKTEYKRTKPLHKRNSTLARSWVLMFDEPSLPKHFCCLKRSLNRKSSQPQLRDMDDFSGVSYPYAKLLLRQALIEFYQNLQQLNAYRKLNATAVRKVVKKFDKTFHSSTLDSYLGGACKLCFMKSSQIERVEGIIENRFAFYFEKGNHKHAVDRLRHNYAHEPHNFSVFTTGFCLGLGLPLFILSMFKAWDLLNTNHNFEVRLLLQIWSGFFFVSLMLLLFSFNILVWKYYRVNYVFVFEFDRTTALDYQQYPALPSLMFLAMSVFSFLTFHFLNSTFGRDAPLWFLACCLLVFLAPVSYLFWPARQWLILSLIRIFLSGLYPVEFRDVFLGDVTSSLNFSISNSELLACIYATKDWWNQPWLTSRCTSSSSRVLGFLNCLPSIWRLMQCLRRYGDTLDWFPHLLNSGKYSVTILYNMFLSFARIESGSETYRSLFITFALINSIYTSFWDILMDFSLGPGLRPVLAYPKWTYYTIMCLDPLMRLNWVLYAIYWNQKEQSAQVSFVVALIELLRRHLWIYFRVENDHCTNVSRFRATKELDLPYEVVWRTTTAREVEEDVLDHERATSYEALSSSVASRERMNARRRKSFSKLIGIIRASQTLRSMNSAIKDAHNRDFDRRFSKNKNFFDPKDREDRQ